MLKVDRMVVGLGIGVVLIAIILAVATGSTEMPPEAGQQGTQSERSEFKVIWDTKILPRGALSGSNSVTKSVEISDQNLTSVTFVLTWTDDDLAPPNFLNRDVFTLTVNGPDTKLSGSADDDDTEIVLAITVNPIPSKDNVTQKELEGLNSSYGTGTWTIDIEVDPQPALTDSGNSWELTYAKTVYYAEKASEAGDTG